MTLKLFEAGSPGLPLRRVTSNRRFGELVVVFQLVVGNGPIDERSPRNRAVGAAGPQLPGPDPRGGAGPVDRGAADGLADPHGQGWRGFDGVPASGLGTRIQPGELAEGLAGILREARERLSLAGFQEHDFDTPAGQLVGERTAARARSDDDDGTVVSLLDTCHPPPSPNENDSTLARVPVRCPALGTSGNQRRSLNPRVR